MRCLSSLPIAVTVLLTSSAAAAQVTGWTHVSGGAMAWQEGTGDELDLSPMMSIDAGLGTSDDADSIVGSMFRVQPVFGQGVDLALTARGATGGFQRGLVGFALDVGGYQRLWADESTGFFGQAILGGPLGLQLAAFATVGTQDSFGFGGTLGIDLAQMTVYREHLLDYWPNHRPLRTSRR